MKLKESVNGWRLRLRGEEFSFSRKKTMAAGLERYIETKKRTDEIRKGESQQTVVPWRALSSYYGKMYLRIHGLNDNISYASFHFLLVLFKFKRPKRLTRKFPSQILPLNESSISNSLLLFLLIARLDVVFIVRSNITKICLLNLIPRVEKRVDNDNTKLQDEKIIDWLAARTVDLIIIIGLIALLGYSIEKLGW